MCSILLLYKRYDVSKVGCLAPFSSLSTSARILFKFNRKKHLESSLDFPLAWPTIKLFISDINSAERNNGNQEAA
jgi:hypothetical protein